MADNITLSTNIGSGSVLATDDTGGAHYQIVKLTFGALDSQTICASGAGAVSAGVQRTTLASDDPGVALLGTIDTDTGVIAGDTTSIDGKITACNTGAVVLAAGTAEYGKLAAGVAEIGNVKNSGTFAVQSTLQAGTAEIGKLAAGVAEIGNVKNSGTFATQATLQAGTAEIGKLAAGTASIGTLGANSGTDIGDVDVTSISAGTNVIGDVGISGARTTGGTTLYKNIDVDESEDQVKGAAGQVYWIHAINLSASVLFLKIYDEVGASVTVGTTVPDLTFPIPTQGDTNGAGFTISIPNGIAMGTGITVAATTGIADNDSGAPAANTVIVNLGYA